jgi:hypothetical protein
MGQKQIHDLPPTANNSAAAVPIPVGGFVNSIMAASGPRDAITCLVMADGFKSSVMADGFKDGVWRTPT